MKDGVICTCTLLPTSFFFPLAFSTFQTLMFCPVSTCVRKTGSPCLVQQLASLNVNKMKPQNIPGLALGGFCLWFCKNIKEIDLIPKVKIGPWPCDCGFIGRTNWFLQCWDFLLSKLKSNWPSIPRQERYIKGCFMSANTLLLFDSLGSYSALGEAAQ